MSNIIQDPDYNEWMESLPDEDRVLVLALPSELRYKLYMGSLIVAEGATSSETTFSEDEDYHLSDFSCPDTSLIQHGSDGLDPTLRKQARLRVYDLRPPQAHAKVETDSSASLQFEHQLDAHYEDFDTLKICRKSNLLVVFFSFTRMLVTDKEVSASLIKGDEDIPGIPKEVTKPLQLKFLKDLKVFFGPIHSELAEEFSRAEHLLEEIAAIWEIELPAERDWSARLNVGASESFNHRFLTAVTDAFKSLGSIEDDTLSLVKMAFVGHLMLTPESLTTKLSHQPAIEFYRNLISRIVVPLPKRYDFRLDFLLDCLFLGIAFPPECGLRRLIQSRLKLYLPLFSWDSWNHPTKVFWFKVGLYLIEARFEFDWPTLQ